MEQATRRWRVSLFFSGVLASIRFSRPPFWYRYSSVRSTVALFQHELKDTQNRLPTPPLTPTRTVKVLKPSDFAQSAIFPARASYHTWCSAFALPHPKTRSWVPRGASLCFPTQGFRISSIFKIHNYIFSFSLLLLGYSQTSGPPAFSSSIYHISMPMIIMHSSRVKEYHKLRLF